MQPGQPRPRGGGVTEPSPVVEPPIGLAKKQPHVFPPETPQLLRWTERATVVALVGLLLVGASMLKHSWGLGISYELGRVLASVHAVAPVAGLADETIAVVQSLRSGRPPRYGAPSALLELVIRSIPDELGSRQRVLVHNDFSVSNVLVNGAAVSAIVDWTEAGQGNAGSDLGFAYVSTALSFGTGAADELLQGYRSRAAWPVHDLAWWQLLAASRLEPDIDSWTSSANFLGPADLTAAEVRKRFDVLTETSAGDGRASAR